MRLEIFTRLHVSSFLLRQLQRNLAHTILLNHGYYFREYFFYFKLSLAVFLDYPKIH